MARDLDIADDIEHARRVFTTVEFGRIHSTKRPHWGGAFPNHGGPGKIRRLQSRLIEVAETLRVATLESGDGIALIEKFAVKPDAVIYCDPPYELSSRNADKSYRVEMDDADQRRFLSACVAATAKVAISGYRNELYNRELADWTSIEFRHITKTGGSGERTEVLWTNYEPQSAKEEGTLFDAPEAAE